MIDLVVPTVTGREADLARCLESFERNTAPGTLREVVIRDETTCGRGWIEGIKRTKEPYVLLCCDDLEMTSPTWGGACIGEVDAGFLPCPIVRRPDGSLESCGGDMNASACLISEMQPDGTEVDFTVVPFGSRVQIGAIGMHAGHYMTDTYFSHKGRRLGFPTRIVHGYEFIHHHSSVGRIAPNPDDARSYQEAMRKEPA